MHLKIFDYRKKGNSYWLLVSSYWGIYTNTPIPPYQFIILSLQHAMNNTERNQIVSIIKNLEEQKAYIPYFSDLANHPMYGNIFSHLNAAQQEEVRGIINEYIVEKIEGMTKTKGGQLFKRFFEAYTDLFRQFRNGNEFPENNTGKFQELGKQVEHEMFKLEGILTDKMLKQEK
jgi:hypothetical protein